MSIQWNNLEPFASTGGRATQSSLEEDPPSPRTGSPADVFPGILGDPAAHLDTLASEQRNNHDHFAPTESHAPQSSSEEDLPSPRTAGPANVIIGDFSNSAAHLSTLAGEVPQTQVQGPTNGVQDPAQPLTHIFHNWVQRSTDGIHNWVQRLTDRVRHRVQRPTDGVQASHHPSLTSYNGAAEQPQRHNGITAAGPSNLNLVQEAASGSVSNVNPEEHEGSGAKKWKGKGKGKAVGFEEAGSVPSSASSQYVTTDSELRPTSSATSFEQIEADYPEWQARVEESHRQFPWTSDRTRRRNAISGPSAGYQLAHRLGLYSELVVPRSPPPSDNSSRQQDPQPSGSERRGAFSGPSTGPAPQSSSRSLTRPPSHLSHRSSTCLSPRNVALGPSPDSSPEARNEDNAGEIPDPAAHPQSARRALANSSAESFATAHSTRSQPRSLLNFSRPYIAITTIAVGDIVESPPLRDPNTAIGSAVSRPEDIAAQSPRDLSTVENNGSPAPSVGTRNRFYDSPNASSSRTHRDSLASSLTTSNQIYYTPNPSSSRIRASDPVSFASSVTVLGSSSPSTELTDEATLFYQRPREQLRITDTYDNEWIEAQRYAGIAQEMEGQAQRHLIALAHQVNRLRRACDFANLPPLDKLRERFNQEDELPNEKDEPPKEGDKPPSEED